MDHYQATELTAVEKYLLDELTPGERDDFEEHFFDCQECAIDLRSTAAFMAAAKKEFQANPVPKPRGATNGKSFFASLWPSALVWSALAASLLVIAYQNLVVYPRFANRNCRAEGSGGSALHLPGRGQQPRGPDSCGHGRRCAPVSVAA